MTLISSWTGKTLLVYQVLVLFLSKVPFYLSFSADIFQMVKETLEKKQAKYSGIFHGDVIFFCFLSEEKIKPNYNNH